MAGCRVSTADVRRDEVKDIVERLVLNGVGNSIRIDAEALLNRLLTALEAAEEQLGNTAPFETLEPVGVWQVELTNGVVYNFVASRSVSGGNMIFPGTTTGLLEFVIDLPSGRSPVVLAVWSELVVSYRRLGDLGRDDGQVQPATFATAPFAGPVQRPAPSATGTDWLKITTKP
jgi:hypothetical protein